MNALVRMVMAFDRSLMRAFNVSIVGPLAYRFRDGGPFRNRPHLILKTIHWKTGLLKEVVLSYSRDGEKWIVIGSNVGLSKDNVWCLNIRAHPTTWVRVDREWHFCQATILQVGDRERAWAIANNDGLYDNFAELAKTRQLPVVTLDPTVTRTRPEEDLVS